MKIYVSPLGKVLLDNRYLFLTKRAAYSFGGYADSQLRRLKNLEMICHGKLIADSFSQLREVTVRGCGRLKNLFPLSITRRLHQIVVEDCETMEEIVVNDEREDEVVFDELRYLRLRCLPKFVQFMCWSQLGVTATSSSAESSSHALFGEKVNEKKKKRTILLLPIYALVLE